MYFLRIFIARCTGGGSLEKFSGVPLFVAWALVAASFRCLVDRLFVYVFVCLSVCYLLFCLLFFTLFLRILTVCGR